MHMNVHRVCVRLSTLTGMSASLPCLQAHAATCILHIFAQTSVFAVPVLWCAVLCCAGRMVLCCRVSGLAGRAWRRSRCCCSQCCPHRGTGNMGQHDSQCSYCSYLHHQCGIMSQLSATVQTAAATSRDTGTAGRHAQSSSGGSSSSSGGVGCGSSGRWRLL